MQMWRVVVLVNLALAVGLGVGYGAWGRRLSAVDAENRSAKAEVELLTREREACLADGRAGEQLWEGHGVVRAVYPRLVVITHEEISGLLPARTTSFRLGDAVDRAKAHPGDPIRFWLEGANYQSTVLVRMEAW